MVILARTATPLREIDFVDFEADLVALEGRTETGWDGARDAVPFVAVVEDVQEGEAGVFGDGGGGGRVDEVPGGVDVCVWDGEGGVEGGEGGDCL